MIMELAFPNFTKGKSFGTSFGKFGDDRQLQFQTLTTKNPSLFRVEAPLHSLGQAKQLNFLLNIWRDETSADSRFLWILWGVQKLVEKCKKGL